MKTLKVLLQKIIEEEAKLESIEVTGMSLDEALQNACIQLDVTLSELDYEILESGDKGIFGLGSRPFRVKVYRAKDTMEFLKTFMTATKAEGEDGLLLDITEDLIINDGEFFLRVMDEGALLKVTKPKGKGVPVDPKSVFTAISERGIKEIDEKQIKKIIKEQKEEYVKIGSLPLNPLNDATANVQINSDKMKAYIFLLKQNRAGMTYHLTKFKYFKSNGSCRD